LHTVDTLSQVTTVDSEKILTVHQTDTYG